MITIGYIIKPHGVDGEVKVVPMTDVPERFCHLKWVTIGDEDADSAVFEVEQARSVQGIVVLKLRGVDTFLAAEQLRHRDLLVPPDEVFPLPEGHYYIFDLIGLEVVTEDGTVVGRILDVAQLPGNDVYVVEGAKGEVLIPATKEIVKVIDREKRVIVIHPLEGLLD